MSYIQIWQKIVQKTHEALFDFNTYIISLLVMFFFQVNYNLPNISNFHNSSHKKRFKDVNIKTIAREFFSFYGNSYNMRTQVISVQIGRWQQRQLNPSQKHQKRSSSDEQRYGDIFVNNSNVFLH